MNPTQPIGKILVPVDFSSYSQSTIDYASMIAEKFDATLILLHVIESLPYSVTDTFKVIAHRNSLQTLATSLLQNLSESLLARKLAVKTRLVWGTASREILSEARREKPDLIVMGTHGRTGLPHVVMGSVAEKTVRLSRVPVLTVPLTTRSGKKRARSSRTSSGSQ
jgi:nucleotide-binding universal stress UspA family protein